MSFSNTEKSIHEGSPIEIYYFKWGELAREAYVYCSAFKDMNVVIPGTGLTFEAKAIPITRENYASTGKVERTSLDITVPYDIELINLFDQYPPPRVISVSAFSLHWNDAGHELKAIWAGRILSVQRAGINATLTCDSLLASFKRPGLRRNFQYGCPLQLYGNICRAARKQWAVKVVELLGKKSFVIDGGFNPGYERKNFLGGMVSWSSKLGREFRTIVQFNNDAVSMSAESRGMTVGQEVLLILGCNHTMDDCEHIHNNIKNYGGQPWIPTKNPTRYHPFW